LKKQDYEDRQLLMCKEKVLKIKEKHKLRKPSGWL